MPERLFENCKADILAPEILNLLQNTKAQENQKAAFKTALQMLSPTGGQSPSQKAAQTILEVIADTSFRWELRCTQFLSYVSCHKFEYMQRNILIMAGDVAYEPIQ